MSEREFCYWLQGLLEVADPKTLNDAQVATIKNHLALVFTKVTPAVKVNADSDDIGERVAEALRYRPGLDCSYRIC